MATTSISIAFVPQFEACPVQQRRRSSTAGTVGSSTEKSQEADIPAVPENTNTSSNNNNVKNKREANNRTKSKPRRSSESRDMMHSLGQSQATDVTAEIDNSARGKSESKKEKKSPPRGHKQELKSEDTNIPGAKGTEDNVPRRKKKVSPDKTKKDEITDEKEFHPSSGSVATETTDEMPSTSTMSRDREDDDAVAAPDVTANAQHGSSRHGNRRGHRSKGKDSHSRHRSKRADDTVNAKVEAFNSQCSPASVAMANREMEYDDMMAQEECFHDEIASSENGNYGNDAIMTQGIADGGGIILNSNQEFHHHNAMSRELVCRVDTVPELEQRRSEHADCAGAITNSSSDGDKDKIGALPDNLRGNDDGQAEKNDNIMISSAEKYLTSDPIDEPEKYNVRDLPPSNRPAEGDNHISIAAHGRIGIPDVEYGHSNGGYVVHGDIDVFDDEDLAIAIAVDDTMSYGDDVFYHAIEYDPDAKPPLRKNRRFRFYIIIVTSCVVLAICTVGIVYYTTTLNGGGLNQADSPTNPPTTTSQGIYREQFVSLVGDGVNEVGSPYDRAANWIMYEDRLRIAPTDELLLQRYILALFYFATTINEDRPWKSCNRPQSNEDKNCDFQRLVRDPYTDEISFKPESAIRWLSDVSECNWVGIVCDDVGAVVGIEIKGQDIAGPIPGELSVIPFLQKISLPYNQFTGTIPESLPQLRYLLDLELHGNSLTGTIPDGLYDILTLQNLNVGGNRLTGTVSTQVGRLTNLKGLHYYENQFNGTIPTEIGNLQYLSYTRGNTNALTGSIPTEFGRLSFLQELWMQENLLSSTIPTEVGRLSVIRDFRIFSNRIAGPIPNELYDNKSQLTRLDLQDMMLTGTLSTRIGEMQKLESMRVRKNSLTGTIPTELASIPTLRLIWVHLNEFSGSIPEQICAVSRKGLLDYITADCGPPGAPSQECACCESCCDRATEICLLVESA